MVLRLIGAALLGGLLMFVWSAVFHMAIPFAHEGFRKVGDEAAFRAAVEASAPQPGFYRFPWKEEEAEAAQQAAWTERYKKGPSGVLVVQERGEEPMGVPRLVAEFVSNVAAAFVLGIVFLLGGLRNFGRRLLVGLLAGVLAWLMIDVSYWNWDGFPTEIAQAGLVEQAVGGLVAAFGVALVLRPRTRAAGTA